MKRFIVAAVVAAVLAAPSLAFAQGAPEARPEVQGEERGKQQAPQLHPSAGPGRQTQQPDRNRPQHAAPHQPQAHHGAWSQGERFDRRAAPHYARVVHVEHYGLPRPPDGHVWVRSGLDAVLVSLTNNIVVGISPNVFH